MGFDYLTTLQTGEDVSTPPTDFGGEIPTGSFWPWAGFDLLPKLPGLEDLPTFTLPAFNGQIPSSNFWPGTGFDALPDLPGLEDLPTPPDLPDMPTTLFKSSQLPQ
jgi:hypothetical protein